MALKSSYWTEWPTLWITTTLNLPCICAIVSYLSNLSFSAVSSIFGMWIFKNTWDRPLNHPLSIYIYLTNVFMFISALLSIRTSFVHFSHTLWAVEALKLWQTQVFEECMRYNCINYGVPPFNCRLDWIKMLGTIWNDLIHKRQSLDSSSLNNIYHNATNNLFNLFDIGQIIYYSASNWAS